MLVISKEQVESLRDRLKNSGELGSCIEEVKRMLEIKSTLLWRADAACGCVGNGPANSLYVEVQLIENTLVALEQGDIIKGASLLDEYVRIVL
ncbi:MAG: hypothetical protein WC749_16800 [Dehalococcoidia bacterium]